MSTSIKHAAIISYLTTVINIISALIVTPMIITSLGMDMYGLYTIVGGFILIISYMDLGIGNVTVRYIAKLKGDKNKLEVFKSNLLLLALIISTLILSMSILIYFNFSFIFGEQIKDIDVTLASKLFVLMAINFCLTIYINVFSGISYGFNHFFFPRLFKLLGVIIKFIIIASLILELQSIYLLVFSSTIVNIFMLISLAVYLNKNFHFSFDIKFKYLQIKYIKSIINFSFWLFIYSVVFGLIWELGKPISGIMLGVESAAIYGLAVMVSGYVSMFSTTVSSMYLPLAIKLGKIDSDDERVNRVNIYVGRVSLFVLLYLLFGFVLVGEEFFDIWLGQKYENLYEVTFLMIASFILPLSQHFSSHLLEAKGYVKFKAISITFYALIGFCYLILIAETNNIVIFAIIPMLMLQLNQITMMVIYKLHLDLDVILFAKKTYLWLLPFIITIAMAVFLLDVISVNGIEGLILKGTSYTAIYALLLFIYYKVRFLGWYSINE
ncbi:MAG: oligosaccharide flippase family protein [Algicola sp.]|nr:oligosaccharide flippase family protein [Algicola sp.]